MKHLKTFENYHTDKVEEGFLTSGWKKTKANIDAAEGWEAKKSILLKAVSGANTKLKGAWINKINAANSDESIVEIINDLGNRPGNDIEDKLAGKTATGAGTGAIFR